MAPARNEGAPDHCFFLGLKLLTTAMGEAPSDYLLSTIGLVGVAIGAAGLVVCL